MPAGTDRGRSGLDGITTGPEADPTGNHCRRNELAHEMAHRDTLRARPPMYALKESPCK